MTSRRATIDQNLLSEICSVRSQLDHLRDLIIRKDENVLELHLVVPAGKALRPGAPKLYAQFFGGFALYDSDGEVALGHSKAVTELCCYLVSRAGTIVAKDELIELLWPDADPQRLAHRLHVTVSALRGALAASRSGANLISAEDSYSVLSEALVTDCDLFERQYQRGRSAESLGEHDKASTALGQALQIYRGDYLADIPFADWTHRRRAHFIERRLTILTFLCDRATILGDLTAVIDDGNQILEIDNLRERTHRQIMRAHYNGGQRACAVRQYTTCAEYLERELGVTPSGQTQELWKETGFAERKLLGGLQSNSA